MRITFLLILGLNLMSLQAQEEIKMEATEVEAPIWSEQTIEVEAIESDSGKLIIRKDNRLDPFLEDYISNKKIKGYRVQLFSGRSRWDAVKVRSDFLGKYEDHMIYLTYQQPNFKLRVGNFRDRLIATEYLNIYKVDFPTAFIVSDEIEINPVNSKKQ